MTDKNGRNFYGDPTPLFLPLTKLSQIKPDQRRLLKRLCGETALHLLWHFPCAVIDRRFCATVDQIDREQRVTLSLEVSKHSSYRKRKKSVFQVRCQDETASIDLVFFNLSPAFIKQWLPINKRILVNGWVYFFNNKPQMIHPDYITDLKIPLEEIGVVYRLTAGLSLRTLRYAIRLALERLPETPEWIDDELKEDYGWPSWKEALRQIHHPSSEEDLKPDSAARSRMAFDELLAHQVFMLRIRDRSRFKEQKCTTLEADSFLEGLPFSLTRSQRRVLSEILVDLNGQSRMTRLVQGDVGSGKTAVAVLALLAVAKAGEQSAVMAPTEILARQHFETLRRLSPPHFRIRLFTGVDTGVKRKEILADLKAGMIDIVVGTHTLFQTGVDFKSLRLIVIDEQHRFGVKQRFLLSEKGTDAEILFLSATPIPRTLSLAFSSGIDISRLEDKPPGRQPITTRTIPLERLDQVVEGVERKLDQGERVYWICPLIKESETLDLTAAQDRYQALKDYFGEERVALLHGGMKEENKKTVLDAFSAKRSVRLLVTTTVIEVGIDIPVGVMVVEHAERFGLAQLHQLRGRIGRDDRPSFCLLLYARPLGPTAKERLRFLRQTEDGFQIAERDYELRGEGDIVGTKQSGFLFQMVDLKAHGPLIPKARHLAKKLLEQQREDPQKKEQVTYLLKLYQRDGEMLAAEHLQAG